MSKVFIPQFAPPGETSREFVTSGSPPGQDRKTVLPLEWPHLQSRDQAMKEEKVLKQAKERALLVEKEAYEKGFAQGEKDGLELGQKRFETVLDSFGKILEGMGRLHRDLYEEHEREMVQLIFALARKILRHDLPLPEGVIRETLRAAFQYVVEPRKISIHLNPKDHQDLLSRPDDLPWGRNEEAKGMKILPDSSITRGGCFLETSFGEIDATLESQLDQILSMIESKVDLPDVPPHGSTP